MRALLLVLALAAAAPAAVDIAALDTPRSIAVRDPAAENHWRRLFEIAPGRAGLAVLSIVLRAPDQHLTLLAARLLYAGPPWRRRISDEDVVDHRAWAERNRDVQGAILRELRWHDDPSLAEVYRRYLADVRDAELAASALVDCAQVDPELARRIAGALATPRSDAPPGAAVPALRARVTAWLVETVGHDAEDAVAALAWALLAGTAAERLAALRLIPPGAHGELLERAALGLAEDHRRGRMGSEEQAALVQIASRLHGVGDPALVAALARLVAEGERPLAAAAATALSGPVVRDAVVPVEAWVARALAADDAAMRHILLGLILRHARREIRAVVDRDSPWRALAEHRARLEAWAWQGVME